ncbi:MAG: ATP-dependent DNA helicase [Methanomassiliicoccales archaeon]
MRGMRLFPYTPRPHQQDFVDLVSRTVSTGSNLVLESGTGTGKTVCSLCGVLQETMGRGGKLLYLTRTNSQQRQVMLELRELSRHSDVFGTGLQGRRITCPLVRNDPSLKGTPEELSKLCGDRKRKTMEGREGGCPYYGRTLSTPFDEVESFGRREMPTVEEFLEYCDSLGVCPYELMKELARVADVVTAPYPYFFVPFIRNSLLDWMNVPLEEIVVIVDEAHNLPEYARETRSFALSRKALPQLEGEVERYGDPEVADGVSVMDLVREMDSLLDAALDEYLIDDDGLIPPSFIEEGLMSAFRITSRSLDGAARALRVQGEIIREKRKEQGLLPRSYIHSLGGFLEAWVNMDQECFVKVVVGGENPALQAYCLDPSLACSPLLRCRATVHMSGTLRPLEEYRDSVGLPTTTVTRSFPSPFPRDNRLVLYHPELTTKYPQVSGEGGMVDLLEEEAVSLVNATHRNTVVFFPSYSLMDRFLQDGLENRIDRKVLMEQRGMSQSDLMETVEEFRGQRGEGGALLAVMGGRISEGLDFPDRDLEVAVLVGIPYPKPTARQRALLHYYELRFGRGWEYTVQAPAMRKTLQAVGRLIRRESDMGVAVILDWRAERLSHRMEMRPSERPAEDLQAFFRGTKST